LRIEDCSDLILGKELFCNYFTVLFTKINQMDMVIDSSVTNRGRDAASFPLLLCCLALRAETWVITLAHSRSKQRTDQRVFVFTLKFLALKKMVFPPYKILPNIFLIFVYLYSMQLFRKILNENLQNGPQKLLIIGPNLFFHSPAPQPIIDLSYYKFVPRPIYLLICALALLY
jgi:hypothetical protein